MTTRTATRYPLPAAYEAVDAIAFDRVETGWMGTHLALDPESFDAGTYALDQRTWARQPEELP